MFCMWEGYEPLRAEVRVSQPASKVALNGPSLLVFTFLYRVQHPPTLDRAGLGDQQDISEMMECGF